MNQPNPGQPAVTTLTAKPGDKVDNYTIMEQIGSGGTAVVFRAQDHVLNRDVAIKQIIVPAGDAGDEMRQRAVAEANAHRKVAASDPQLLVQFIDIINDNRGLFLISEFVDGPSLEAILQQETRPMDQRQALGIVAASAKALGAIHQQGMVHRDLKPSNILMPREGGLKLADFGLAAVVSEQQSMDLGSVRYMAPETLKGEPATAKSDLYSLGIVAYEMLAGRDKFDEAFRTILRDQRNQAMRWVKWHTNARTKATPLSQLIEGIPQSLSDLVERMMEKEPARRVGSSADLLEAIRKHFAGGGESQAPEPKPHAAMTSPDLGDVSETAAVPQRSKLALILAGMLVVWGIAIGGFFVWQNQEKQQDIADRIALVHEDIEKADRLHTATDYAQAVAAFEAIPEEHGLREGSFLSEVVEAGVLRSGGMLDVENNDYISALAKFESYERLTKAWSEDKFADGPDVRLSYTEANRLAENNAKRAVFQQIANDIAILLDEGKIEEARQDIQAQRDRDDLAQDDEDRLDQLDRRRRLLANGQRIATLLNDADALVEQDELDDAIELLADEVEREGDDVSPDVTQRLAALRDQAWLADVDRRISRARSRNENEDLLDALREKQSRMPSEELSEEMRQIEITMLLNEANTAMAARELDRAERVLNDILEMDRNNEEAQRMLGQIRGGRMQVGAMTRGDQLFADGQFTEAIEQYNIALQHGPDPDGQIAAKIQQCNGRIAQAAAEDALDRGDIDAAQSSKDSAVADLGETAALAALQQRIDELSEYREKVSVGDEQFADGNFGTAKRRYLEAQQIFDSAEMRQKIRLCEFNVWLDQCDAAIDRRDWEQAESCLKQAEQIEVNDQTQTRRTTIENRVQ